MQATRQRQRNLFTMELKEQVQNGSTNTEPTLRKCKLLCLRKDRDCDPPLLLAQMGRIVYKTKRFAIDVDAGRCFNQIYGFSSTLEQWRFSNHIRIGISNPVRFPQTVVRSTAALKKPQGLLDSKCQSIFHCRASGCYDALQFQHLQPLFFVS
ncbi:hypothetical protein T08_1303 [Trichinella sp. T8]|nr:hypothetical protein T08_1303 [Trichinella sp. T8]